MSVKAIAAKLLSAASLMLAMDTDYDKLLNEFDTQEEWMNSNKKEPVHQIKQLSVEELQKFLISLAVKFKKDMPGCKVGAKEGKLVVSCAQNPTHAIVGVVNAEKGSIDFSVKKFKGKEAPGTEDMVIALEKLVGYNLRFSNLADTLKEPKVLKEICDLLCKLHALYLN